MSAAASASDGRIHGNKKRPPGWRSSAAEGLTTRRHDLPMAGTHPMYPCPLTRGNLSYREGRSDG